MRVHFLGICGTFMGSLSILARELGYQVSGQDLQVYPPMSTQLAEQGITLYEGYDLAGMPEDLDLIVVGNVMTRGMPIIEYLLNSGSNFISGPQFLAEHILPNKHVLVVSGTHGKTTTSSMLAWILEYAGVNPSFLIGGVPNNFNISARLTTSKYFVIEGDEYDCAFFDKRSKFLHYRPATVIINNIEYDHADIFRDLSMIQDQFHHLVRIIPERGTVIAPVNDPNVATVLARGCWSKLQYFGVQNCAWQIANFQPESWPFLGEYNHLNAVSAIAAANSIGIDAKLAAEALTKFLGVKRRLEIVARLPDNIVVYSDFGHHPTAIRLTLNALKSVVPPEKRLLAVVDLCSNTMRTKVHQNTLGSAVAAATKVYLYHSKPVDLDLQAIIQQYPNIAGVYQNQDKLVATLLADLQPNDNLILLSNGALVSIEQRLLTSYQVSV